ncbi:ribosome maturation factor RimM [Alkalihalobacillus sp. AL-G]|uniref:ribosome maturation factor RimM n=1 Tax=Alkalihalobacillus sp. AL-G TaxID=2926399 RepID=UPI00272D4645|nr:ribosome maturation factor RimM [Alkalihalobacillus sp. AL-G]WLD95129.1 ribosome maturation factor RimM [Alkalihalobacillus sp. AL-G]
MSEWLNVGKIVNTHGIKGEVRVITRSDFSEERYEVGSTLYLFHPERDGSKPLKVRSHRKHKQFDLVAFEDHPFINDVEGYKGGMLKVSKETLSDLPEGEYYYYEIIGCDVYTMDENKIGEVRDILSPGANDVWVVYNEERRKEYLIPYIDPIIKKVDPANKKVWIEPMEGLLE